MKFWKASIFAGVVGFVACTSAPMVSTAPEITPQFKSSPLATAANTDSSTLPPAPPPLTASSDSTSATADTMTAAVPPSNTQTGSSTVASAATSTVVISGSGVTTNVQVIRGVDGSVHTVRVESPFASIIESMRTRWYSRTTKEKLTIEPGQSIVLPDGTAIGPLNVNPDESRLEKWQRTSQWRLRVFHLGDDGADTNPLGCVFSPDGTLLKIRPVERVTWFKPNYPFPMERVRASAFVIFRDPSGHNGFNAGLLFSRSNRYTADCAEGYFEGSGFRIGPDAVPAAQAGSKKLSPIPAETATKNYWYKAVSRYDYTPLRLVSAETSSKPQVGGVTRRSKTLEYWIFNGVTVKQMHHRDCTGNNCHPEIGEPEVGGPQACREECAEIDRYDFLNGDLDHAYFEQFLPNGVARTRVELDQ